VCVASQEFLGGTALLLHRLGHATTVSHVPTSHLSSHAQVLRLYYLHQTCTQRALCTGARGRPQTKTELDAHLQVHTDMYTLTAPHSRAGSLRVSLPCNFHPTTCGNKRTAIMGVGSGLRSHPWGLILPQIPFGFILSSQSTGLRLQITSSRTPSLTSPPCLGQMPLLFGRKGFISVSGCPEWWGHGARVTQGGQTKATIQLHFETLSGRGCCDLGLVTWPLWVSFSPL
jgi:hypothetical protein